MLRIDSGLLALIVIVLAAVVIVALYARSENAKNERWLEAMREMGKRCPDCGGVGFHLLLPAGTPDSAPDCRTCNGTGKIG